MADRVLITKSSLNWDAGQTGTIDPDAGRFYTGEVWIEFDTPRTLLGGRGETPGAWIHPDYFERLPSRAGGES